MKRSCPVIYSSASAFKGTVISSGCGSLLSNENCGRLLSRILHDDMKQIVLGHLSHENNLPELAYETVRVEVTLGDNPYKADDFPIMVAKRGEPSPVINL